MQNYCPRIHHGLTLSKITNTEIGYSVCCWTQSVVGDVVDFHHPKFERMRLANRNDQLISDVCKICLNIESTGQQSQRQGYSITHGQETFDNSIQYLDIQIDNTCNLACVSCGPQLSTTWRKELGIKNLSVRPKFENFITRLEHLDLSMLREIRFWGGEPFLTNTWKNILHWIKQRYDTSNVKLMFNTNGTCKIDDQEKHLIEEFKFARISFSIDAVGPAFEYIRYPASWQQVDSNLQWWRQNLPHNSMLSLTVTASLMNVLSLNSVFNYCKENFSNSRFGDPIEIYVHPAFGITGLENMPKAMVDYFKNLSNYCQPWLQALPNLGVNKQGSESFVNYIQKVDQRRNYFFYDAVPIAAEFFNYRSAQQPIQASNL